MDNEIYKKIISKKEFSKLPKKDVELAFSHFEKRETSDEDKIKLTRDLLRKVFSAFTSQKLLNLKDKDAEWFLKKHISTRERFDNYTKIYSRLLKDFSQNLNVIDLGCGINGFGLKFLQKINPVVYYFGIESMGQLVDLQNYYFKTRGFEESANVLHLSLFDLEKLKKYINQLDGEKIVFLFKVLDSLEMLEKNYSKKLLFELSKISDKIVVSYATKSLIAKKKFSAKRTWLKKYISENFEVLDEFEISSENYIVFQKK